jgi:hypothetical protein
LEWEEEAAMSKIVIGIHGLANKPVETELATWWKQSIEEGLGKNCNLREPAFEFQMAYWADLVYRYPVHTDPDYWFDQLYNDEPYREAASGSLQERKTKLIDDVKSSLRSAGGWLMDRFRDVNEEDSLAQGVLEKYAKDLAFYYDNDRELKDPRTTERGPAREIIKGRLKRLLLDAEGRPIMLVSHSMGTIVAYDVLRDIGQVNAGFEVAHFVTMGSPLGLPYVKKNVDRERKEQRTPTVVSERWMNYSCPKDKVCLDMKLRDDYKANRRDVRVQDDFVNNDYASPAGKPNPHKSYGYLRTPEFSEHVASFLRA